MRTFKEFLKELEQAHDCEKCHGKIFCIAMDKTGITRCGYCHEIVNYPVATKEEFISWMEEASHMKGIKEFIKMAREKLQ